MLRISNRIVSRAAGIAVIIYLLVVQRPIIFSERSADILESVGLFLLVCAVVTRIFCLLFSAGSKNKRLLIEGPFSVVRNPLYVSSFIGIVGFGLVSRDPFLLAVLVLFTGCYYTYTVSAEERHLSVVFGTDYKQYCSSTARWLPDFSNYHAPTTLEVHPALILRGTIYAMAFLLGYFVLQMLDGVRDAGLLPLSVFT